MTEEEILAKNAKIKSHKKDKISNESRNERFWRLILRKRDMSKALLRNFPIQFEYTKSIGKFGESVPSFKLEYSDAVKEAVKLALDQF